MSYRVARSKIEAPAPDDLYEQVAEALDEAPEKPWDAVLADLAARNSTEGKGASS
jgi:hypothetical protein